MAQGAPILQNSRCKESRSDLDDDAKNSERQVSADDDLIPSALA